MKSDNIIIKVRSSVLDNIWYKITRFTDYDITVDMETDTDQFSFTFDNPDSIFTGLVSGYDRVNIIIGDKGIMHGIVDSVNYSYTDISSSISVSGRDKACLLTDNDVNPLSKKNVKPVSYIGDICSRHNIIYKNKKPISPVNKFDISAGTSEASAIATLLEESHQQYWYLYDTFYTGEWNTGGESKWRFTRGVTDKNSGIPIKQLSLIEDYADTRSTIRIYGSNDDGDSKFAGSASLDIVEKRGFKKVSVIQKDSDVSKKVAASTAEHDLEDSFRDAFTIKITVHNDGRVFMPDTVCTVVDKYFGINATMYIRAVRYYMTVEDGSLSELTLIPSKATLKKLMNTGNIMYSLTNTTRTSLNAKLQNVLKKYDKKWS